MKGQTLQLALSQVDVPGGRVCVDDSLERVRMSRRLESLLYAMRGGLLKIIAVLGSDWRMVQLESRMRLTGALLGWYTKLTMGRSLACERGLLERDVVWEMLLTLDRADCTML